VPGRVAAVPLDLAIGHYKTPSIFDVRAVEWFVVTFVSNDGDGFLDFLALLFCGLLFFAARLRLIFAFRFLAMCLLQILFQGKHATKHHTFRNSHSLRSCEDHTIKNSIEFAQHHCAVRTKRFLAPGVASSPSLFNPRKQR
jgi:hypothetical protein